MRDEVLGFCRDNGLFSPGDQVTAAVSGGADSMALLAVLCQLREELGITVRAAHFNHGLRPGEAQRDEAFVRDWCQKQNLPLSVGRGDVTARAAQTGESVEEAARALRYAFLLQAAQGGKLATAHTADDNAETLLLHLLRGTGLRGLCGIPPRRETIVRPLLGVTRSQIETFLEENRIPHVEDSTNAENDCVRNRLRHEVIPLLRRENPSFSETVFRTCGLLRQEEDYLSALAAQAERRCALPQGGYDCRALGELEPVLRRRVLLSALRRQGLEDLDAACISRLERLIFSHNPSARVDLTGGRCARRSYDALLFDSAPETPAFAPVTLQVPGQTFLPELGLTVTGIFTKNSVLFQKTTTTFYIKCDMITETLWMARPRQPGDRLRRRGGSRSVKRLMIDEKIPAHLRGSLPVITCNGRVAAVWGLGVDEDFRPLPGESALALTIERKEAYGQDPRSHLPGASDPAAASDPD